MAYNGSGVFERLFSWAADKAAAIKIRADRMDQEMDGFAAGLSNCITRDGQSVVVQNIPFNGKRLVNIGDPVDGTDAVNLGYLKWDKIAEATATNFNSINIALPSGYSSFLIQFWDTWPSTTGQALIARVSLDNGSTFISSSGAYKWAMSYANLSTLQRYGSDTGPSTSIALAAIAQSNSGSELARGWVEIDPSGSGRLAGIDFNTTVRTSTDFAHQNGSGDQVASTGRWTNIIIFYPGSNISGSYAIWGRK